MLNKTKKTPHLFHSSSLQFYEAALRHLVVPNGGAGCSSTRRLLSEAHKGGAQQTFKFNCFKFIISHLGTRLALSLSRSAPVYRGFSIVAR